MMGAEPPRCCVALVCGIPGAGKSTLARALDGRGRRGQSGVGTRLVSFDEVGEFAERRAGDAYRPEVWKASRSEALAQLERDLASSASPHSPGEEGAPIPDGGGDEKVLVLVDDSMHLRSMRRQVFHLARKHGAGLVVVHLDPPLALCLDRNRERAGTKGFVPEEVVRKVAETFDANFESHVVVRVADPAAPGSADALWDRLLQLWRGGGIAACPALEDLEERERQEAERKQQAGARCSKTRGHVLDNLLRKELSSAVAEWRERGLPDLQQRARLANEERKRVLQREKAAAAGEGGNAGAAASFRSWLANL